MKGEEKIKKVGIKALATIALISLLVGLGVGLDRSYLSLQTLF